MSIFPSQDTGGGVVYRDDAGHPTFPSDVHNAYSPAPAFTIDCPPTALPSTCDARVEAQQVNSFMSELLAFAECLNPGGNWDCLAMNNLCMAFQAWDAGDAVVDGVSIVGSGTIADPFRVGVVDGGTW